MDRLRIGVVGLGSFCRQYHIPHLLTREDVATVAVCDALQDAIDNRSEALADVPTFTDYEVLLDTIELDGLVVSTSNASHYEICKTALERDIPTIVDKPLTVSIDHASDLVDLSKARNIILMTAFTRHFMSSTEYVRREIASGALEVNALTAIQRRAPLPIKRPPIDGGMLHRRGVHVTDVLPWLSGRPITSVTAAIDYDDEEEESIVDACFELEGGLRATYLGIKNTDEYQDEVNVYGVGGSYLLMREDLYVPKRPTGWEEKTDLPDYGNSTVHFIDAIQGEEPAEGDPYADRHSEDGLRSLRVAVAMHESAKTGDTISID